MDQSLCVCPCGDEPESVHNMYVVYLSQGAKYTVAPPPVRVMGCILLNVVSIIVRLVFPRGNVGLMPCTCQNLEVKHFSLVSLKVVLISNPMIQPQTMKLYLARVDSI